MKNMIYLKRPLEDVITVSKLVTIYYFEYKKAYSSRGESHDFWEINYVDRGNITVICNETEYKLSQGDLIALAPNQFHILRSDSVNPSNVFIISFEAQTAMPELLSGVFHLTDKLREHLDALAQASQNAFLLPMPYGQIQLLEPKINASLGSQQLVKLRLEELLIRLMHETLSIQNTDSVQVFTSKSQFDNCIAKQILEILRQHIYGQLTLEEVSKSLGYGKTYLSSIFKNIYGTSIISRYIQLKIEEAQYLLREDSLTITEISDLLGFSSPQYFSKRFSQAVGMSPQQFMKSIKRSWSTVKK